MVLPPPMEPRGANSPHDRMTFVDHDHLAETAVTPSNGDLHCPSCGAGFGAGALETAASVMRIRPSGSRACYRLQTNSRGDDSNDNPGR